VGPVASFITTFSLLGVVFTLMHLLFFYLRVPDLVALLLFGLPVTCYIAYCTEESRQQVISSALRIYFYFAAVLLSAAGLVYFIGE
jgi:hypothetical protein